MESHLLQIVSSYRIVVLLFFSVVVFAIHLDNKFFAGSKSVSVMANDSDVKGFADFLAKYKAALPVERKATEVL